MSPGVTEKSAWSPLSYGVFRALWLATIASNLGTWMQNVGASWLMTLLTTSPLMITLVQTATSAPVFLLGLPAGAIADFVDRRRLLLVTQAWMLLAACALSVVTFFGFTTPLLLLALTFALGIGAAMNAPAWQAIFTELVPRDELANAVALNSAAFNMARAVGPALAGLVLARGGPATVFLLNSVSFVGVWWVLYRWQEQKHVSVLPGERLGGAMRAGLRYLQHAPELQLILSRTILFGVPASALWGLLPVIAKREVGGGPLTYGILLGGLGVGALLGAWFLPKLRLRLGVENLLSVGSLLFAGATVAAAVISDLPALFGFMVVAGISWIGVLSSMNTTVRMRVPTWIEARSLAFYMIAFQGSMAIGSFMWGSLASYTGSRIALMAAGATLAVGAAARFRYPLPKAEFLDLTPAKTWSEPELVFDLNPNDGPVFVTVEYRVPPENAAAFRDAIERLRILRKRDGAFQWGLFVDTADPAKYVEEFMVETWVEHLRQHQRMTVADGRVQELVESLVEGRPRVSHHIAAQRAPATPTRL